MSKSVSVIIPTFRRPAGLRLALQSVANQTGLRDIDLSLVVCDNSPEASARTQVEAFASGAPFPVTFVHEPRTGVANARNAAVAGTSADFIAFLDDDEEAPPHWLARLVETQARFAADVVFGPVKARLQDLDAGYPIYFESFFSRTGPKISQRLSGYYGCGNSLIRRAVLPEIPFATYRNEMGGEDDQLFHDLQSAGAVIAWAADALVYEDVPASRSTLGYTLRRAFAFGQGPSHSAALSHRPLTCAAWMAQGIIQGLLFSLLGGVLYMIGSRQCAPRLDKAMRGFGKLIWFPPFKIGFYGAALLHAQPPAR
jgi:cellulose synthase/poly-beta-1,6-N-acetylglucosamine synthase-like glycosyltransferase